MGSEETDPSIFSKEVANPKLDHQRIAIEGMIKEYEPVFDEKTGLIGKCERAISTGDAPPVKNRPRPLPPRWEEEINRQLDELLEQKQTIKLSLGEPLVLVSKKDGRQRFAIDYRNLNQVTKKDAYSIPQMQSTVEPAITATLYNGHLSIAVTNEQSRPKFHNIEPVYSGHLLNAAAATRL